MKHDDIRYRLDDFVDGLLPPTEHEAVAAHLAACAECAAVVAATRSLLDAASELPESVEPPRDLWAGIAEGIAERPADAPPLQILREDSSRIADPEPRRGRTAGTLRPAWLAAAALALLRVMPAVTSRLVPSLVGPAGPILRSSAFDPAALAPLARDLQDEGRRRLADRQERLATRDIKTLACGFADVESALAEARAAYEEFSDSPEATAQLGESIAHKITMMEMMARRTASS